MAIDAANSNLAKHSLVEAKIFVLSQDMNYMPSFFLGHTAKEIRALVQTALSRNLPPKRLPGTHETKHLSLYLSESVSGQVEALAQKHDLRPSEIISRLAYAALIDERGEGQGKAQPEAAKLTVREKLQNDFYSQIQDGMNKGCIVMAEASTGIGKTRVGGKVAHEIITRNPKARVWVVVPSIQNVVQTYQEFEKAIPGLSPAILLGRGQFIVEEQLRDLISAMRKETKDSEEEFEQIEKWLDSGALPITREAKALNDALPGISHLRLDLESISETFPGKDCSYQGESDCSIAEYCKQMVDAAESASCLICTHAMVANFLMRTDKEKNFPWSHLIIDEGHLLEENIAQSFSVDLSFMRLKAYLRRKGGKLESKLRTCSRFMEVLRELPDGSYLEDESLIQQIESFAANTNKLIMAQTDEDRTWKRTLQRIGASKGYSLNLSLSPVRKYPSVIVGPKSIAGAVKRLWESVEAAVLMSGTLQLPLKSGAPSYAYQKTRLRVPLERTYDAKPIEAPWIRTSPVVHIPARESFAKLTYNPNDESAVAEWQKAVAKAIRTKIHPSAKGGTLVLCNSHSDAESFAHHLLAARVPKEAIIYSVSASEGKRRFKALVEAGKNPVWMGTGPAWTGLDLKDDCDPAADFLLTDLVVVRAPFNVNRTSTHVARKEWMGYRAEICDTTFRFRQGLGRLIRSEGLKDRRMWILDPRIWSNKSYLLMRQSLSHFKHVVEVKF